VAEKYGKKLLGEDEIKAVLQRLDRLGIEESREVAAQTLDVVFGLVKNIEVIMEGGYRLLVWLCNWYETWTRRWQGIDRCHSTGAWCVWLICAWKISLSTLSTSPHARISNERKEKRTFVEPDIAVSGCMS